MASCETIEVKLKPNVRGKIKQRITSNIIAEIYFYPKGIYVIVYVWHKLTVLYQDIKKV